MPWLHMATLPNGDVKLCCIAQNDSKLNLGKESIVTVWNGDYYKKTRAQFLAGEEVSACSACWKEERIGIESHRMIANRGYINRLGQEAVDKILSDTENGVLNDLPPTLDLRLGNTCNLECIMCQPGDSSKWVSRSKKLADKLDGDLKSVWIYKSNMVVSNEWYKKEQFWNDIKLISPSIKHITFGGGEPLYIKEHKILLDYIIDSGYSTNIELHYHTNGTIYDSIIVERWSKFKEVKVMISIDGYADVNSYIRRPANWKTIEDNLKLYDNTESNIITSINTTVQMANVTTIDKFAQWLLDQDYKKIGKRSDGGIFFASLLHYPPHQTVQVLPKEFKKEATSRLQSLIFKYPTNSGIARLSAVVDFMNAADNSNLFPQSIDFLKANDQIDGTFTLSVLELNSWIDRW